MAAPMIKKAWETVPAPLRKLIRRPLNLGRRLIYGMKGAKVEVGGVAYWVDYQSGTELGRARVFATLEGDFTLAFAVLAAQAESVLDVGANMGLYTLLAAVKNPRAAVYALEPEPHNQESIARNLVNNQCRNAVVLPMALGDQDTELTLELEGLEEIGAGTRHHISNQGQGITVRAAKLDTLVQNGEVIAPDLVKMDIEGYELRALKGMQETLAQKKPDLLLEVHPDMLRDHGDSAEELEEMLAALGYRKRRFESEDSTLERAWYYPRD